LIERADVTGLVVAKTAPLRVTGVAIGLRDGGGQSELAGDLVVDASGRSSKAPAWFGEIGLEPPAETVVDSFAAYASRWFQAPPFDQRRPGWWWEGHLDRPDRT
jgi:hypothetical protein